MQTAQELSFADMEQVFASIEIPPCPAILVQVMSEAQKDAPDINALSKVIATDVGLSAYAIKLANSALFRGSGTVNTVPKAVARLGTRNIVCTVVAVSLRNNVIPGVPPEVLERFWDGASLVALGASLTARHLRGIQPDMAYTYALFHDSGIPMMMRRFADYHDILASAADSGQSLIELEKAHYPCTHPIVGALMARNWGLPANLFEAIRHHHDPQLFDQATPLLNDPQLALVACTHVAEYLISELGKEPLMEGRELYQQAIDYLGLAEDDLHELGELIVEAG